MDMAKFKRDIKKDIKATILGKKVAQMNGKVKTDLDVGDLKIQYSKAVNIDLLDSTERQVLRTKELLIKHKSILNSIGLDDLNKLGSVRLSGKISPSVGVFYPGLISKGNMVNDFVDNGGFALNKMKVKAVNARLYDVKKDKEVKIRNNSTFTVLPSVLSSPGFSSLRSVFPVGHSYLVAGTLSLMQMHILHPGV